MTDTPNGGSDSEQVPPTPPMAPPSAPPVGGTTPPPPPTSTVPPKWYEATALIVIALLCCGPLGLILTWINTKWSTKTKWIITGVLVGVAVLGMIVAVAAGGGSSSSSSSGDASKPTTTVAAKESDKSSDTKTTATAAAAAACKDTPDEQSVDTKKQGLYPTRMGITKNDHEAAIGDCVRIDGLTGFVVSGEVVAEKYSDDKVIVINVTEKNRDKTTKNYNMFDWKLQTPAGVQESPTITLAETGPSLRSGQLVQGGQAAGVVAFDYDGPGTYYVIWDPSIVSSDLGVWAITVP